MKITFCLLLAACFVLIGCGGEPKTTTGVDATNAVKAVTNAPAPK